MAGISDFASQHQRAKHRAAHMDRKWFGRRPMAILRLRDSLPFEAEGWGAEDHVRLPYTIVFMDMERSEIERRHFRTANPPPTDQASLIEMWKLHIELEMQVLAGGSNVATAEQEKAMAAAAAERVADNPSANFMAGLTGRELAIAALATAQPGMRLPR